MSSWLAWKFIRWKCLKFTIRTPEQRQLKLFWCLYCWIWTCWKLQSTPSPHLLIQSQQWKHQNKARNIVKVNNKRIKVNDIVMLSLLLTLNIFHTLLQCFHCWIWTSRCQLVTLNYWPNNNKNTIAPVDYPLKSEVLHVLSQNHWLADEENFLIFDQRYIEKPVEHLWWSFSQKRLHHRPLTASKNNYTDNFQMYKHHWKQSKSSQ